MLFGAEITKDTIKDENKLCEQLYIFLGNYINKRLTYESDASREDCVQDTIMFILKRFNELSKEQKNNINLEKFFYNRAHSFIGNKLRWKKKRYKIFKKYAEELRYLAEMENSETAFVDKNLLVSIIDTYKLKQEAADILLTLSLNKLIMLGYFGDTKNIDEEDEDPNGTLDILSYSVVDEYLVKVIKDGGSHK